MEAFWWLFAIVLMALGLIGTVIPIVPGTTIILAVAVVHRVALGADRSLGMSALIAMLALTLLTYAIDAAAGYMGAKRFGATKWGLIGGAAGEGGRRGDSAINGGTLHQGPNGPQVFLSPIALVHQLTL